jgi:hypothetical protein
MNGIWVRSQDKKRLACVSAVWVDGCEVRGTMPFRVSSDSLGYYPTESRALEVLDEIHARIDGTAPPDVIAVGRGYLHPEYRAVYQMPES